MSRRNWVLVGLISTIACGFAVASAQTENHTPNDGEAVLSDQNEGMWEIDVQYPIFGSPGAVPDHANEELASAAEAEFSSFLADAEAEVPELREIGSPGMYILNVTPAVTMDLPELCSAYIQRMVATGGANANQTFSVFNYALDGEVVRKLELADLFVASSDPVAEASKAALEEIQAWDSQPSYVADGSWTELAPEEAQRFVITEVGLLFLFNKYELGPGAEGTRTVLVPYDSLPGLDYEGYLKPLFESGMQD